MSPTIRYALWATRICWLKLTRGEDHISSVFNVGFARSLGVHVGEGCRLISIYPGTFSTEPYLIALGSHVSLTKPRFITHDGAVWVFRENEPNLELFGPIKIGDNVFAGYGVIFLPNTLIGNDTIIAAGAVVKGEFPSGVVLGGTPAKVICTTADYFERNKNRFSRFRGCPAPDKQRRIMDHLSKVHI